ncbi:MAG: hypothetical protein QOI77_1570 [Blastocatellia bacterium]|jgi:hypothetical protein|nr:hypothetical protein [Blastocatellia bacterium]
MKQLLIIFFLITLAFQAACTKRRGESAASYGSPQRVSAADTNASEPAVTIAKDGGAYVVWVEHRDRDGDVMLRRFNGAGQPLGDPIRINPQPGQATAWRGDPPTVAVAADGTLYVGWTARVESSTGNLTDIYLSASRDGGKSFASPVKVNDDQKPAVHGMHSLAISDDGRVYLAWLDERNVAPAPMQDMKMDANSSGRHVESNREVFLASSVDGGQSFSQNQRVATDVCPCCKTSLAVAKDGRIYVSWRQVLPGDYRHIAVSSSSDQGKTFAKPSIVSDDEWVLKGCPVSGAALLAGADATLRVLWYAGSDKGQRGVYWSESRDAGKTFTPRQLLAASSARGTPVLLRGQLTSDIGVWQSGEGNKAQILLARLDQGKQTAARATNIPFPGELPAAAVTNQRVFIVYVASDSQRQTIWLMNTTA